MLAKQVEELSSGAACIKGQYLFCSECEMVLCHLLEDSVCLRSGAYYKKYGNLVLQFLLLDSSYYVVQ